MTEVSKEKQPKRLLIDVAPVGQMPPVETPSSVVWAGSRPDHVGLQDWMELREDAVARAVVWARTRPAQLGHNERWRARMQSPVVNPLGALGFALMPMTWMIRLALQDIGRASPTP